MRFGQIPDHVEMDRSSFFVVITNDTNGSTSRCWSLVNTVILTFCPEAVHHILRYCSNYRLKLYTCMLRCMHAFSRSQMRILLRVDVIDVFFCFFQVRLVIDYLNRSIFFHEILAQCYHLPLCDLFIWPRYLLFYDAG